jgi:deoxyribonucleoside regulator
MFDQNLEQFQEMKEMIRCVQLYYGPPPMQQREIAEKLNVSASKVSRHIKRASQEGYFEIVYKFPLLPRLADGLIQLYGLRDAFVVPTGEEQRLKEELGITAARYFEKIAGDKVSVGLSCGYTLYFMVKHLREGRIKGMRIYPLASESMLQSAVDIVPNTLVGMMAAKYRPDVTAFALPAQFVSASDSSSPPRIDFSARGIRETYEEMNNIDVAVTGVGDIDPDTPGVCALAVELGGVDSQRLRELGAVGEFNYQLIDREGNEVEAVELERVRTQVIGVGIDRFRELSREHGKTVIAVAGGKKKADAIHAALEGKLCNVLITDHEVAVDLIERKRGAHGPAAARPPR